MLTMIIWIIVLPSFFPKQWQPDRASSSSLAALEEVQDCNRVGLFRTWARRCRNAHVQCGPMLARQRSQSDSCHIYLLRWTHRCQILDQWTKGLPHPYICSVLANFSSWRVVDLDPDFPPDFHQRVDWNSSWTLSHSCDAIARSELRPSHGFEDSLHWSLIVSICRCCLYPHQQDFEMAFGNNRCLHRCQSLQQGESSSQSLRPSVKDLRDSKLSRHFQVHSESVPPISYKHNQHCQHMQAYVQKRCRSASHDNSRDNQKALQCAFHHRGWWT